MKIRQAAWATWLRACVLSLCTHAGSGCLPERKPAIGEHLVEDRGIEVLAFAPGPDGNPGTNAIYARQSAAEAMAVPNPLGSRLGYPTDLYVVPTTGGPIRVLATGIEPIGFYGFPSDARGRILFGGELMNFSPDPMEPLYAAPVSAVDVTTGEVTSIGVADTSFQLSSSRRWAIVFRTQPDRHFAAVSVDGSELRLDVRKPGGFLDRPTFVGNRIYFVDADAQLVRVDEGVMTGVADAISADPSDSWHVVPLATADMLVRAHYDSFGTSSMTWQLLGTTRSGSILEQRVSMPTPSPDGTAAAFIVTRSDQTQELRILTLGSGSLVEERVDLPPPPPSGTNAVAFSNVAWRQGASELWCFDDVQRPLVWRRGQPLPVISDRMVITLSDFVDGGGGFSFQDNTRMFLDGDRWFVFWDSDKKLWIGDASDPRQGPAILISASTRYPVEIAVLESGKRLAVRLDAGDLYSDLYTLDVTDGTMRFLATHVAQALYGPTQILALNQTLKKAGTANLSFFDAVTGAETLLAQNVTRLTSAPPCPTCGALDPGARILFTVQGRYPYGQDGIWVATLP